MCHISNLPEAEAVALKVQRVLICQGIFSILGDTDNRNGYPSNTGIPKEIYRPTAMVENRIIFCKYYVHMCSVVKIPVYAGK